jgi:glycosidase
MLIAENTTSIEALASYFRELPSNFNFPLAKAIVDGVKSGDASGIVSVMREDARAYPKRVIDAPFLTNHDQIRIATVLENDPGKLRNAAAILLTLPGMPFIYYGEEVGMQNDPGQTDEAKRRPMPWTMVAAETGDPQSLLAYYRTWIAVRHQSQALLKGDLTPLDTPPNVLAYVRSFGGERVAVVHNLSASSIDLPLKGSVSLVHGDPGVTNAVLPPHTSGVWRMP